MAEGMTRSLEVDDVLVDVSTAPPEVLEAANEVVSLVITQAEKEVIKRKEAELAEQNIGPLASILKRGTRWHNRARGIVTRILTHFRICK